MRRYLALERIRITAEDLQGVHPRKVAFMPHTGQAMVKKLRVQAPDVAAREAALAREAVDPHGERAPRVRPRVELFGTPAPKAQAKPRIELFGMRAMQPATRKQEA